MHPLTLGRNPHAGEPFTDDDAAIEKALEDVSIPALLCSLVHMTGDLSWIRDPEIRPQASVLNDYQSGMPDELRAEARRRALPAIAKYRDGGCVPYVPPPEVVEEMMDFLACAAVDRAAAPMFIDDLHLDGADSGRIEWGDEISDDAKRTSHVVVIGCGESGLLAGIRLAQAGLPFTIVEKSEGAGGTW